MTILSSPFLFTALAASKGQSKKVVQRAVGKSVFPSVLPGSSKTARVPLLTKSFRASVYRPSVEALSAPAFTKSSSRGVARTPKRLFQWSVV
eukprot:CAMPEP_0184516436 /NCGR_PEP_ID=MMETSP0198_2-20121128/5029_1 /TAXON_ID=1112570 /ORGANISM="Thraustochytrium sp., Strain LLF1b" /LENGTH=91 /DNA_ID=CAMNT_0026906759 /DNA_START=592 /DNA_END=867 /DNA_ORIENTATION=-